MNGKLKGDLNTIGKGVLSLSEPEQILLNLSIEGLLKATDLDRPNATLIITTVFLYAKFADDIFSMRDTDPNLDLVSCLESVINNSADC